MTSNPRVSYVLGELREFFFRHHHQHQGIPKLWAFLMWMLRFNWTPKVEGYMPKLVGMNGHQNGIVLQWNSTFGSKYNINHSRSNSYHNLEGQLCELERERESSLWPRLMFVIYHQSWIWNDNLCKLQLLAKWNNAHSWSIKHYCVWSWKCHDMATHDM